MHTTTHKAPDVGSNPCIVEHQEVAAAVIYSAVLDAGTHKDALVKAAVRFALSDDFDMMADLANLSDESADRVRSEILSRAASSSLKIEAYRQRRRQMRAG